MTEKENKKSSKPLGINEEEIIKTEKLNPKFKREIEKMPGGETLALCFQCGKCTASCPIRRFDDRFHPRLVAKAALLGMRDFVLSRPEIWMCATCYSCTERCPQGVRLTDVIRVIRNIAVKEGHVNSFFAKLSAAIAENGRIFNDDSFINEMRGDLGLPPVTYVSKDEVAKILRLAKEKLA